MNDNKKFRIWQAAVALLVLCNIALVAIMYTRPMLAGPQRPETPRDFVIRNVHLTQAQVKQYDALIDEHRKAMHRLQDDATDKRKRLFERLAAGEHYTGSSTPAVDSLAMAVAMVQQQVETVTYLHFAQVRALCTAQQQADFDRIITDVTRRMNPGHRPPPGDGPGDRRQGGDEGPPPADAPPGDGRP